MQMQFLQTSLVFLETAFITRGLGIVGINSSILSRRFSIIIYDNIIYKRYEILGFLPPRQPQQ